MIARILVVHITGKLPWLHSHAVSTKNDFLHARKRKDIYRAHINVGRCEEQTTYGVCFPSVIW